MPIILYLPKQLNHGIKYGNAKNILQYGLKQGAT
jgi:hypothetical protein